MALQNKCALPPSITSVSPELSSSTISGGTCTSKKAICNGSEENKYVNYYSVFTRCVFSHSMRFFTALWKMHLTSLHIISKCSPKTVRFFTARWLSKFMRFSTVLDQITYDYNGLLHTVRFFITCVFLLHKASVACFKTCAWYWMVSFH